MATSTHDCPGGCGAQVARHMLACKRDWYRLPKELREAVWDGWQRRRSGRPNGVRDHARAVRAAIDWYVDNPS
jgi:hypothetical protein